MLVVQTIFTINGQMENSVKYAFWSYLDKKKYKSQRLVVFLLDPEREVCTILMCMCAGLKNGEGWFGVSSCFHSYTCIISLLFYIHENIESY